MSNRETIDYSWRSKAKCKGYDLSKFYSLRGEPISQEVRELCSGCPVRLNCLTHALHHEKYGFWAGTTEQQRRILRRKQGIKAISPETLNQQDEAKLRGQRRNNPKSYMEKRRGYQ